jgi:TctA family transporter
MGGLDGLSPGAGRGRKLPDDGESRAPESRLALPKRATAGRGGAGGMSAPLAPGFSWPPYPLVAASSARSMKAERFIPSASAASSATRNNPLSMVMLIRTRSAGIRPARSQADRER